MNKTTNMGVLTRSFGRFNSTGYIKKEHELTIGIGGNGGFTVTGGSSDVMVSYIKQRREDLGGGSDNFQEFCTQLFEDVARYVQTYAARGGYPENHHTTISVKDECAADVAVLKISSDVSPEKRSAEKARGPLWRGYGVSDVPKV